MQSKSLARGRESGERVKGKLVSDMFSMLEPVFAILGPARALQW